MGNWSLTGILFTIGLFLVVFAFLMLQIKIENPLTGIETSIFSTILNWIVP